MRMVSARVVALCCSAVFGWSSLSDGAVFSIKAMTKNGAAVTVCAGGSNNGNTCTTNANCPGGTCVGTNNLPVVPGDTIEAHIQLSGWGAELPQGVRTYQVTILGIFGFFSGPNSAANVLPLGWKGPQQKIECPGPNSCVGGTQNGNPCTSSANCPGGTCTGPSAECLAANPSFPTCTTQYGCVASGHNPSLGAMIDATRSDFIFAGQSANFDIDLGDLNYSYFGLLVDSIGVFDTGVPKYVGTLIMQVSSNACGTYTIAPEEGNRSFISDPKAKPNQAFPSGQALVMTVTGCIPQLVDCDPGAVSSADHCDIDARIPHDPLFPWGRRTTNQMVMKYDRAPTGYVTSDYEVTLLGPPGQSPPTVTGAAIAGSNVTVSLGQRIFPLYWTCIRDKRDGRRCCMGSQPANADGYLVQVLDRRIPNNLVSQPADVFEGLDNLQGGVVPSLPMQLCDMDRSLLCTGADLLMTVDMLAGVDGFVPPPNGPAPPTGRGPYNGAVLPACPRQVP